MQNKHKKKAFHTDGGSDRSSSFSVAVDENGHARHRMDSVFPDDDHGYSSDGGKSKDSSGKKKKKKKRKKTKLGSKRKNAKENDVAETNNRRLSATIKPQVDLQVLQPSNAWLAV